MKNTNKIKSITSALVLGSALMFNACSSDMFDTEKKDTAYYLKKENQAETKKKAEWCLSLYNPDFKSVKDFLSDEAIAFFSGDPSLSGKKLDPDYEKISDPDYEKQDSKRTKYSNNFSDFLDKNMGEREKYSFITNSTNCVMAIYSQILIEDVKNLESEK